MRFRYRCSRHSCQARVTLPRLVEQYVRPHKCHACGGTSFRLDKYRHRVELHKSRTCECDGYHFPHRMGCQPWCKHSTRLPTDLETAERYGERA